MSHGAIQKIKVASFFWNTVYINSQQTINSTFDTHVAYFVWVTMIWRYRQQFGSKLRYVWQWAPKISWQPWLSPWRCPAEACSEARFLRATTVTFLHISHKPPNQSCKKPMKRRFQRYLVCTKILSTFHTRLIHFFLTMCHWNEWGKLHETPSPYTNMWTNHIHHSKWQLYQFTHFCTTNQQNPYWLRPKFTPILPSPSTITTTI